MVKRTHLDLSAKCGSTPTRPGLANRKDREWGYGVQFPFSIARHYANSAGFLNGGNDGKKKKNRGQNMGVPKTEYEYHFWDRALFFLQGFP